MQKEAEKDSVKATDDSEYKKSLPRINRQMKALLARDLWDMNEFYQIFNEDDEAVTKAMELIKERDTDALLMRKKK